MLGWLLAVALAVPAPPAAVAPLPAEQVMALPAPLQATLHDTVLRGANTPRERYDRLVRFIVTHEGLPLVYRESATLSVAEVYERREANCLSFTLLFLAMAKEAGLEAWPQEIDETLSWQQRDNTVYRNSHVNVAVRIGRDTHVVDVSGDTMIARSPPVAVSEQRLLSHYYNNQAIAFLAQDDPVTAARFSEQALALDASHPDHWSNAGVIRARNGQLEAARQAHAKALALAPDHAGALFNAMGLAHRMGEFALEAQLRERLARVQRSDPFHQFLRALDYEHKGDHAQAITHYRRAIQLHPGEHRFHAALARAWLVTGDRARAIRALARARALSKGSVRADYEAQIQALRAPPQNAQARDSMPAAPEHLRR